MEFIDMIGITNKKRFISLKKGVKTGCILTGIIITNPDDLPESLSHFKPKFLSPDDQLNQYRSLEALHIDQSQLDCRHDESPSQPRTFDLLGISIHQPSASIQITVNTMVFRNLWKYLIQKVQA